MHMPRLFTLKLTTRQILVLSVPLVIFAFVVGLGFRIEGAQQFSELAQGFLKGHPYFLHAIGGEGFDPVYYDYHIYWSEGAFPAIILLPFVAFFSLFHLFFFQGYIKWLFMFGVLFFVYRLARIIKYTQYDSIILALGFALGTVFIGVASVSSGWLYAQVIEAFLVLWALYEYYSKRRWWLIGAICGMIFLTRATAAPIALFFALELWQRGGNKTERAKRLLPICIPLGVAVLLQGFYNFIRFRSPLDGGYEYQLLGAAPAASRALGVFSPLHIPANLFALIFATPLTVVRDPVSWTLKFPYIKNNPDGLSIFITSPYFLYLFTQKWKSYDRTVRNLLAASGVSCLGVLCFYGLGRDQLGDRYSLDFLPELFLIFMIIYRKKHTVITNGMKFLLIGAGVLNFYILFTFISL
jgi:hypothetical protein